MEDDRHTRVETAEAVAEERDQPAVRLALSVTLDRMAVLLHRPVPTNDPAQMAERLEQSLCAAGVVGIPDPCALERLIAEALAEEGGVEGLVVVEGEPAQQPVDGRLEWAGNFFETGYAIDSKTGRVDYWERREDLAVHEAQVLAHARRAKPGKAGKTVFGQTLPVANPVEAAIRPGENVECREEEDATVYVAAVSGRLRWVDHTLTVDKVFKINGDVGIDTGNVKHPGAVEIKGDVKDGATIEAEGDIIVHGVVEPSRIVTNGSLVVDGGVVGRKDSTTELGGGLMARYLLEANVVAGGDIEVEREISRSNLRTRGKVLVPRGRIVGGEVVAGGGIVVRRVGSGSGSQASLVCKRDDHAASKPDDVSPLTIEVLEKLVAGTTVTIGSLTFHVEETISTPCKVLRQDHQLTILPLSDVL